MATTHGTPTRTAFADQVIADAGIAAVFVFLDADGTTELVEIPCENPIAPPAGSGSFVLTTPIGPTPATVAGTAAFYEIRHSDSTMVVRGSVSESGGGGDVIISNESINVDDPISVSSYVYQASP